MPIEKISFMGNYTLQDVVSAMNSRIEQINNGGVDSNSLAAEAVTAAKIPMNAIVSNHIGESQIERVNIQELAVGSAQIEELDAGKVKTGTLDTNLVTVGDAAGKTTIAGDTIKVKDAAGNKRAVMGDIDEDGNTYGFVAYAADGVTKMFDGTGLTKDGIPDHTIETVHILERSVTYSLLDQTTANATLTVGAGQMFADPQAAFDSLPKIINHDIIIQNHEGTYGDVEISNLDGSGSVTMTRYASDTVNIASIFIHDCQARIIISSGIVTTTTQNAIYVLCCQSVYLSSVTITAVASDYEGIQFSNSSGTINRCTISNRGCGVYAEDNSVVQVNTIDGTGNLYGIYADGSICIDVGGNTITGTHEKGATNGGFITPPIGAIPSGKDAKYITGTPGTNGNLPKWNADGDLVDSGVSTGAWADWGTTPTNLTVGSGTLVSRCCEIGKTRICHIEFTYGTGSSVSGEPSFSLPDDINAAVTLLTGTGTIYDSSAGSTGRFDAFVFNGTSSTVIIRLRNASGTYVQYTSISSTVPFTWATGDKMVLDFTYEAV
jgi:hypothetical protein